mgnify:CR=1 FL=1
MKTITKVHKTDSANSMSDFIDKLYEMYGDRVVNLTMDGTDQSFILFFTIRQDEPVKVEQNID